LFSSWILQTAGSLLFSAAVLVVCFLFFHPTPPERFETTAKTWTGRNLGLFNGRGYHLGDQLVIQTLSPVTYAITKEPVSGFDPSLYPLFVVEADGLWPGTRISLIWRTRATPSEFNHTPVPWSGGSTAAVYVGSVPQWSGEILELGLALRGRMKGPISLNAIRLFPHSSGTLLRAVWSQWMAFERWRQYSINFLVGGIRQPLVFFVPAVAAWLGLALFVLILVRLIFAKSRDWRAVATICMLGWLVLDLHWQVNLFRKLELSPRNSWGERSYERRLAERDRRLFAFADAVKKKLPSNSQRIFLVSSEEGQYGYYLLRVEYFLRPHNVYIDASSMPARDMERIGGYAVVIGKDEIVPYDDHTHKLRWLDDEELSATLLLGTDIGKLYQIDSSSLVSGN
jgi:hypothetical protein